MVYIFKNMLLVGAVLIFIPDLKLMKILQGSFESGVLLNVTSITCHKLGMLTFCGLIYCHLVSIL